MSGKRVSGTTLNGDLDGRLGGGGANAACALIGAGHDVKLVSLVSTDEQGRKVISALKQHGVPLDFVSAQDFTSSRTLVFVDKDGERTIVGLDAGDWKSRSDLLVRVVPAQVRIDGFAPDGVYLRQLYPGMEKIDFGGAVVVVHWPMFLAQNISADVLVASRYDLDVESIEAFHAEVNAEGGNQVTWVVLTHGGGCVTAYNGELKIEHSVTRVAQCDATGAGDVFAAALTEALAAGADMRAAIAHASNWGAIAVSIPGSAADRAQQARFQPFVSATA